MNGSWFIRKSICQNKIIITIIFINGHLYRKLFLSFSRLQCRTWVGNIYLQWLQCIRLLSNVGTWGKSVSSFEWIDNDIAVEDHLLGYEKCNHDVMFWFDYFYSYNNKCRWFTAISYSDLEAKTFNMTVMFNNRVLLWINYYNMDVQGILEKSLCMRIHNRTNEQFNHWNLLSSSSFMPEW